MNKNLLKLCILGCAAVAFNACDTGDYKDLECDASYVAECLSENALMFCENGKLNLKFCAEGSTCIHVDGAATCAADGEGSTVEPIVCSNKCIDGTKLKQCNSDGSTTDVDCSLSGKVCENNACVEPSSSCVVSCAADGITLNDCDGEGNPVTRDCSKDSEGNDTGKVCGDDGNGSFACVEASS